jgi:hypothetical protein
MRKNLLPEERLEILRALDRERKWYSLDDKRICTVCDRVFTGRQIEFTRDPRGRDILRCRTAGCPAGHEHWFLCEVSPARFSPRSKTVQTEFFTPNYRHA